jgi:hypothetical protein
VSLFARPTSVISGKPLLADKQVPLGCAVGRILRPERFRINTTHSSASSEVRPKWLL